MENVPSIQRAFLVQHQTTCKPTRIQLSRSPPEYCAGKDANKRRPKPVDGEGFFGGALLPVLWHFEGVNLIISLRKHADIFMGHSTTRGAIMQQRVNT